MFVLPVHQPSTQPLKTLIQAIKLPRDQTNPSLSPKTNNVFDYIMAPLTSKKQK
jgi:hypothetical protein